MVDESILLSFHSWPERLKRLHRLQALCEICPVIRSGEHVRASANLTGVGALLLPKSYSLDKPEMRRMFFRHTQ